MAAASAAISAHDVADAARQLDAAPEGLRDWEWRHLRSRLDDSSVVVRLPEESGFLLGAPYRLRAVTVASDILRITDLESGEVRTLPFAARRGSNFTITETRRGLRVVSWTSNTTFELLDEAGQILCRVEALKREEPGSVFISPDGKRLALAQTTRPGAWARIELNDANSGKQTAVCDGHRVSVWACTFSPDGARASLQAGKIMWLGCGMRPQACCWRRVAGTRARSSESPSARTERGS